MLQSTKLAALLIALSLTPALAEQNGTLRIGVLNDMSGVYSDVQGPGSVIAAQMAVEDYGGKTAGKKVEVLSADHQNKTDIGAQAWPGAGSTRRRRDDRRRAQFGYRARSERTSRGTRTKC